MDPCLLNNFVLMQQLNGKKSYTATKPATEQFSGILNKVVSRDQTIGIASNEGVHQQIFRQNKDKVEDGKNMREENEDNESIYKTVKKLEKKLIKLARLERKMLAGF